MIRLCAFADEAGASLTEQIAALKEHGISLIELRGVDGKNVAQLTDEEAEHCAARLRENGIRVWSIGSPLGKVPLAEADAHMQTVRRVCELARIFSAERIRMFSFYKAAGERARVVAALRRMAEIAREYDVLLCHENEKEIFGDTVERVESLVSERIEGLRFVFDPANYIQCGVSAPMALERLFDQTDYFHIKDVIAETGELVPAGFGDGGIVQIPLKLAAAGRDAVLTVEPHLAVFDGYAQFDNEVMKHRFHFNSTRESFAAAVDALKQVLEDAGYHENKTEKGWCIS